MRENNMCLKNKHITPRKTSKQFDMVVIRRMRTKSKFSAFSKDRKIISYSFNYIFSTFVLY